MASTNQSPFYKAAESKFLQAITDEEKIIALREMIKECPKHKSSENMLANLKTRLKKFLEKQEKARKSGKGKQQGIKKPDMQALLIGMPNTGKSSLFKTLTKQKAKISNHPYTTIEPLLGTANYEDTKIQVIDMPPLSATDQGLINNTDTLIIVIDSIKQLKETKEYLKKANAKQIIVFNKADLLNEQEKRKISATLKSQKKDFVLISSKSTKTSENLNELKQKLFESFPIIRVYTKEPKKPASKEPMVLKQNSTAQDVAEKILKGMSQKIKRIKIWGPSSKFPGQIIGLDHILKDKDTIEFQTT